MNEDTLSQRAETVRRFNRFYTRQIGVLQEGLLKSPFSLTEARVIYELAHHETTTATELGDELGLDAGYLSRILRDFKRQGLIDKKASKKDGRQSEPDDSHAHSDGDDDAKHRHVFAPLDRL